MIDLAAGPQPRKRFWNPVIAIETRYLLDQVGLSIEIGAARRRSDLEAFAGGNPLHLKAKHREQRFDFFLRHCYAEQSLDPSLAQHYGCRCYTLGILIQSLRDHCAPGQFHDETGSAISSAESSGGI